MCIDKKVVNIGDNLFQLDVSNKSPGMYIIDILVNDTKFSKKIKIE